MSRKGKKAPKQSSSRLRQARKSATGGTDTDETTQPKLGNPRRSYLTFTLLALGMLGVVGAGYLAWQAFRPPPVTIVELMDELDVELAATIERHAEAARREPRDARLRAMLGLVYEANKLWPEARSCFQNATGLDRNEPMWPLHAAIAWLKMGDVKGATAWMRRHAARFPAFAPLQHRLGLALLDAAEIEEAEAAFRRVITHQPTVPAGYAGLGEVMLRSGEPAEAARILEQAVQIDPHDKAARYLLGRAYRDLGRLEEAEREMTLGMGAVPRFLPDEWSAKVPDFDMSIGSQQMRAAKLLSMGNPAEAAQLLERILASEPENVEALLNLGAAYLDMGRLDEAFETLHHAGRLDADSFGVYINLATYYRRLGRPLSALEYADRAFALAPDIAQTHHARGLALMQLGRNEEALEPLTTAVGLDPQNPKAVQDIANVCTRLGRHDAALAHFETLARLLPTRWEPQLGLAGASYQLGRFDEAEAALIAGLALAPDEPRLLAFLERLNELQDR